MSEGETRAQRGDGNDDVCIGSGEGVILFLKVVMGMNLMVLMMMIVVVMLDNF